MNHEKFENSKTKLEVEVCEGKRKNSEIAVGL